MSLQTVTTEWRDAYDQTEIGNYKTEYIGSMRDTAGVYHTGKDCYEVGYKAYDFKLYAGQGVDHTEARNGGGKYLIESNKGFSWNTVDQNSNKLLEFVTSGSLDKLILGYTPDGDYNPAPKEATLTDFSPTDPMVVVNGFNIAMDAVAASQFGVKDSNSAISVSAKAADGTMLSSILANAQMYESVTLNSAVMYSLAFDNTKVQAFEWVLDKYLESKGSDITDSFDEINAVLKDTGVSITYNEGAADYSGDFVSEPAIAFADMDSDLLLAA